MLSPLYFHVFYLAFFAFLVCKFNIIIEKKVFVILQQFLWVTQKYALYVSFKRHFCLSFSLLYLLICSSNFVMIETDAYDIARDEIVMSSYYSKCIIGSGQKQPLVFYNKNCC